MLNNEEKTTLRNILNEAIAEIDTLVKEATNDSDKEELINEANTLKQIMNKLDL